MAKPQTISRPAVAWQSAILRLTAFPPPSLELNPVGWWDETVGALSENAMEQKKTQVYTEEGEFVNGRLTMGVSRIPPRIDWVYAAPENVPSEDVQIKTLGLYIDNVAQFKTLVEKWLSSATVPPIVRLAFGTVLVQPTETSKRVNEILASYLPRMDLNDTSDFSYQINRPRKTKTKISNLTINRLSKWGILHLQSIIARLPLSEISPIRETYAALLELDISTSAEFKQPLPKGELKALFRELVTLGEEIAVSGDIA